MNDNSRTESDAAHFAAIAGRDEDFGGGVGDQEPEPLLARVLGPDPWGLPNPSPTIPLAPGEPPF